MKAIETLRIYDARGNLIPLGSEVGRGGEAVVYATKTLSQAVKMYHQPTEEKIRKLELMIARPPADPTLNTSHISFSWPTGLVCNEAGNTIGFTMPLINTSKAIPLHQIYNPKARRQRATGMTWQYLVRIGRNLAAVVAALHAKGYVIGDLNESNVLVNDRALVTLVDCDSIQVRKGPTVYRCTVGKGEYTPPELQGKNFATIYRNHHHDDFGLAILLFLLLMEGVHPFSGVYTLGEPPGILDNIRNKRSPYLNSKELTPMPIAPSFSLLPATLQRHFRHAFSRSWRPTAKHWQKALENLERNLVTCSNHSFHIYGDHLNHCPWCQRKDSLGLEPFSTSAPVPHISKPRPRLRGFFLDFLKQFPLITLGCILSGIGLGYALPFQIFLSNQLKLLISTLLLCSLLIAVIYQSVRRSSYWYKIFRTSESILKAVLGSLVVSIFISLIGDFIFGFGSIFKGDWSIFPALWVLGFGVAWKYLLRRKRFDNNEL